MRAFPLALALLLAAAAFGGPPKKKAPPKPPPPPTEPMPKVKESVNDKVLALLTGAEKMTTWRVASSGGLRPDPARAIGADFTREHKGKELSATELLALRGVLYADKSYRFDARVDGCSFDPAVSFQTESGLATLETLVSFKCNQVVFFIGKPGGRWVPSGTFDIKPARKQLLELAKAGLPQDAPTQALK